MRDAKVTRCWLCNELGRRAVQCKNRKGARDSSSQEKRNEKSGGAGNAKAGQAKVYHAAIEVGLAYT